MNEDIELMKCFLICKIIIVMRVSLSQGNGSLITKQFIDTCHVMMKAKE